jgi:hypothetical protein
MAYVAYKSSNVLGFFNELIATGTFTRTSFSLPSSYISIYMFLVSFFVAVIALIIYILMRQKKKPKLLYLFIIIYYLGLLFYYFYIYNTLGTIEVLSISPRSLRVIRDVTSIVCYIQYASAILIGIRAVGFNIQKFNFGEDLHELEIDVTDNEEFELTVGIDPNKISRRLRKGRREIRYFIIENSFILTVISFTFIAVLSIIIFLNIEVYDKVYKQSELFRIGNFVNKVTESHYTNLNQKGEIVAPNGKIFVVVNINFNNKDKYSHSVSLDNINLMANNKIVKPITTLYQSFVDLGVGYIEQVIKANEQVNYIFAFQVDDDINFNKLYLRYRESITFNSKGMKVQYRKIKLDGININKIEKVASSSLNDTMSFKDTSLGNTRLKVSSVQIENNFEYDAVYCINSTCATYKSKITLEYTTTDKMLMRISPEYTRDTKASLYGSNTLSSLIKTYSHIRYIVNNRAHDVNIIDETPRDYLGKDLFFQVPTAIKNADIIELVINIRGKEFIYNLK